MVAAAWASLVIAPGQVSARTLDEIMSSGVLRYGVETDLAPLGSYDDTNKIVGFDVDVANKLAEKSKEAKRGEVRVTLSKGKGKTAAKADAKVEA